MAWPAQPDYVQGLAIVRVVHFGFRFTAVYAGLTLYFSATQVNVGIAPAVILEPLFVCHRVIAPMLTHTGRMARVTVTLVWTSCVSTFT